MSLEAILDSINESLEHPIHDVDFDSDINEDAVAILEPQVER